MQSNGIRNYLGSGCVLACSSSRRLKVQRLFRSKDEDQVDVGVGGDSVVLSVSSRELKGSPR